MDKAFEIAAGWVRDGVAPGVAVAVARRGVLVGEFYGGKLGAGGAGPVDAGTLYSVASATKPFAATAMLRLVERGDVALDEGVRRIVPAFSAEEKRDVTIRDLLCHVSGLPKDDPAEADLWAIQADFAALAASAAALPIAAPTGTRVTYSNAGYWVLGAGIAAVAGMSFPEALRVLVLEPFGLSESFIAPPAVVERRIARRYGRAKIMNAPYGRGLGSPSSGLFATARDLVRFASIFLAGGVTPEGKRVLSAAAVDAMVTDQTGGLPGGIDGLRGWPICPWGLGWEVKGEKRDHWTGELTSSGTFCHIGQGGALVWADPATGIACVILANRDISTGWITDPARWARLSNAIVAAAAD